MSNTRNTPVEIVEHYLPVRLHRYGLRDGLTLQPGERLRIETPGGGGFGSPVPTTS